MNGLVQDGRKWLYRVNFFFVQKCLNFCMCFSIIIKLIVKHSPVFFLAGLHFVSEKNKDNILKCAQWTQQSGTKAFQPKKIQGNVFLLNRKAHAKIQALLKEKVFTQKSILRPSTKPFNLKKGSKWFISAVFIIPLCLIASWTARNGLCSS